MVRMAATALRILYQRIATMKADLLSKILSNPFVTVQAKGFLRLAVKALMTGIAIAFDIRVRRGNRPRHHQSLNTGCDHRRRLIQS